MIEEIDRRETESSSFAFETTLSGIMYARHIPRWRKQGYHVKLIFLSLLTVEIAIARVAARVKQGGHDIPENVVRRRYESGLKNFRELNKPLVDSWILYDNSGEAPRVIEQGQSP